MARRDGRKGRRAATGGEATIASGADPAQLLPMALHHHERGDLERARTLYQQVIDADPEQADALQFFGILCHQQGDAGTAESMIRKAIAIKPGVAPYHDNLGTVLERSGRISDALDAYAEADRLEPDDPDRSYNMGVALVELGRAEEAETRFRQALALRVDDTECRFALANVLRSRGAGDQARELYRIVLNASPEHAGALVNLANLLQETGEYDEAAALYGRALSRQPRDANAHHNLALLQRRMGNLRDAEGGFRRALEIAPGRSDSALALAQTQEERGELEASLRGYLALLDRGAPSKQAATGAVRTARVVAPMQHLPLLGRALLEAIGAGDVPAAALARALGHQLAARARLFDDAPGSDAQALARARELESEAIVREPLRSTANIVPAVELWLTAARRALLGSGSPAAGDRELLLTLALQATLNDHVFAVTDDEHGAVQALQRRVEAGLGGSDSLVTGEELALLASYVSLGSLAGSEMLPQRLRPEDAWLHPVVQCSLLDVLEERERARSLETVGVIDDPASQAVRALYEQFPYPRWQTLPATASMALPLRTRLAEGRCMRILVAGCGTGQEALAIASRYPEHEVVGLDLSRASLAYASRMAEALGIDGVRLVQGDLLQVDALGEPFDVIAATGVLHHLAEPVRGWRALREQLAPGGLMRIGLYSATARAAVNAARTRIQALGLGDDLQALRSLRARILGGSEPALAELLESEDFYTTSTCKDLLFHPVEHQFDLAAIGEMLDGLGLRFLEMELPHPLLLKAFQAAGVGAENDLAAWARFEERNPDAFAAMYVFWCEGQAGGDHA